MIVTEALLGPREGDPSRGTLYRVISANDVPTRRLISITSNIFFIYPPTLTRKSLPPRPGVEGFPWLERTKMGLHSVPVTFFELFDPLGVLLFRPPVWYLSGDHNPQSTRIAEGAQVNMDRDERGDDDKAHVMDEMRQNQH